MRWIAKAAIQGVLAVVPGGRAGNRWLQEMRRTPGPPFFGEKLACCREHLRHFFAVGGRPATAPFTALELGTGRIPIVPLGLALCGAVRVTSIDLVDLVHADLTRRAVAWLVGEADAGRLKERLPWALPGRVDALRRAYESFGRVKLRDALGALGIELRIGDVRVLARPDPPIDLVVSNNTLEHVERKALADILAALRRVAASGAVMSHFIDLADHYSHFDRQLTPYNFLRYRPATWRLFNNRLQYQNRLRVSDYRAAHARAGFRVVLEENDDSAGPGLEGLQVAREFRHYSRQDLAVTSSWMVSRPAGPDARPYA